METLRDHGRVTGRVSRQVCCHCGLSCDEYRPALATDRCGPLAPHVAAFGDPLRSDYISFMTGKPMGDPIDPVCPGRAQEGS